MILDMTGGTQPPQQRGPPPTLTQILQGAHGEALKRIEADQQKVAVITKTLEIIASLPDEQRDFVDKCLAKTYS